MSKKSRERQAAAKMEPLHPEEKITLQGWRMIWIGIATAFTGFVVLSYADSLGRNGAATLSPFLILGGYAVIGLGIFAAKSEE